ncbi:alkaline phosphatase family protein [Rhizobium terrae]|uniref:alkaline phosphatase family protein n=1 Tax=Rhizobium terrae TaxID=2171756 RepID=UPI000E3B6E89|nr:alkaline phosphatase family protein [Rhizobium terrae]
MPTPRRRQIIIFGIDGLRPDMISEVTTPNIHALYRRGVWARHHRTVFPSETRGALTSLVTGSHPETHGILGNQFFARQHLAHQTVTTMAADWFDADRALPGGMVTAIGLSEILAKNGRSFAVVTSSGQGSLSALNWRGDICGQAGYNVRHPQTGFPDAMVSLIRERHRIPDGGQTTGTEAKAVEVFAGTIWKERNPDVSIIWLTEADSASHLSGLGSPQQLAKIGMCDNALGMLLDWRDALPERDDVTILVTSDHGHSTIKGLISVTDELRSAGFSAGTSFTEGNNILVRPGRAVGIWLRNPDRALSQDLFDFFVEQDWYGGGFSNARAPGANEGVIDGTLALELTRSRHFRAPDLCINLAGNDENNAYGIPGSAYYDPGEYNMPVGGGTHGGLHVKELSALLIAHGADFLSNATSEVPTSIVDIAPTVLTLLGLDVPATASGRFLAELTQKRDGLGVGQLEVRSSIRRGKQVLLRLSQVGDRLLPEDCTVVSSHGMSASEKADGSPLAEILK